MPTTATSADTGEAELTPELIERVLKLSPDSLSQLVGLALGHLDGPPDDPEVVKKAWKEEIARRVASIDNGTAKLVDAKESLSLMRVRLRERYGV